MPPAPRLCFDGRVRVLFATTAGAGHFGPMIPIARACVAAGHEVAVAAPEGFASHVKDARLPHLPFPDVPEEQLGAVFGRLPSVSREEANRLVVSEVFGRLDAQAAWPTLMRIVADWRPDVVVRDPCEFGSLVAAAGHGIPQAQLGIGLGRLLPTVAHWADGALRELEAMAGLEDGLGGGRLLSVPVLTSLPAVLDGESSNDDGPARVWRYRSEVPAAATELPGPWGDPAAPLVYVTLGSVAGSLRPFQGVYAGLLEVLAELPVRVLMTVGPAYDVTRLDPVPANTLVTSWWPQAAVMPEAALMIGHGGFGTTMIALAAGVPQVVLPLFAFDQFLNAERVEAVGAGLALEGGPEALGQVADRVMRVLAEPGFAAAAREVAQEMAALPDVTTTVDVLANLAS